MRNMIKDHGQLLDPIMACYHAAHDYPGGVSVVAHVMNANYNTFTKKLNPTQTTHVLTVHEMLQIMQITGDVRIIDALAASADGVFIASASVPVAAGDIDLLKAFSDLAYCAAGIQQQVTDSLLNGGHIDTLEFSQLQRAQHKLDQAQAVINQVSEQFRGGE